MSKIIFVSFYFGMLFLFGIFLKKKKLSEVLGLQLNMKSFEEAQFIFNKTIRDFKLISILDIIICLLFLREQLFNRIVFPLLRIALSYILDKTQSFIAAIGIVLTGLEFVYFNFITRNLPININIKTNPVCLIYVIILSINLLRSFKKMNELKKNKYENSYSRFI